MVLSSRLMWASHVIFLHLQNGYDTVPECGCDDVECHNADEALSTTPGT